MPKTVEEIQAQIQQMRERARSGPVPTPQVNVNPPIGNVAPTVNTPKPQAPFSPSYLAKLLDGLLKKSFDELKKIEAPAREWMIEHKHLKESDPARWKRAMQKYDVINRALQAKVPAFQNEPVRQQYRTYE